MSVATLKERTRQGVQASFAGGMRALEPVGEGRSILRMGCEQVAMFAALLALDHWAFGGLGFAGISPNPLWFPVLVMSAGYGVGMGLCAAGLASLIWVTVSRDAGTGDHLQAMLRLSINPMLWIVAALIIGELTSSRLDRLRRLHRRCTRREQELNQVAATLEQVGRINRSLQVRIVTEERTVSEAIVTALKLVDGETEDQTNGVEQLVGMSLQTDDFVFYCGDASRLSARFRGRDAVAGSDELTWHQLARKALPPAMIDGRSAPIDPIIRDGRMLFAAWSACSEPLGVLAMPAPLGPLPAAKAAEISEIVEALFRLATHFQQSTAPIRLPTLRMREHAA